MGTNKQMKYISYLLSIISGVLLAFSYPKVSAAYLAFIGFIPLFIGLSSSKDMKSTFVLGYVTGVVYFSIILYWIADTITHYGGLLWPISYSILALLVGYLALYPALFSIFWWRWYKDSPIGIIFLPASWVILEYIRAHIFTGFPWALIGHSQWNFLLFIQSADILGTYAISFLVVLVNSIFFYWIQYARQKGHRRSLALISISILGILILIANIAYGINRIESLKKKRGLRELKCAMIQANIDQSVKWNPAYQFKTIDIYRKLTHKAFLKAPDIIIWPETATPFFFGRDRILTREVRDIVREVRTPLITGTLGMKIEGAKKNLFNRAILLSTDGNLLDFYDKVHLVPFGEYVPLKSLFPFLDTLVPSIGNFSKGHISAPIKFGKYHIGILICFESIFPSLAREECDRGANLLVILTNDAWFGRSSAPYQHFYQAVFRAIENRRYVLRAANTGITGIISPIGEVLEKTDIFQRKVLVGKVQLFSDNTFYEMTGDFFIGICFILLLLKIGVHELACLDEYCRNSEINS